MSYKSKGSLQFLLDLINMELTPNKTFHPGKKIADKNRYYHFKRVAYIVELTQGKFMICDESPLTRELLTEYTWYYSNGYAKTTANGQAKFFHQIALTYDAGFVADHINRCRSDNRLNNLRIVTQQINNRNRSKCSKNKTGKIGVSRVERKDDFGRIEVTYRVMIRDPEWKLSLAKTYTKAYTVGGKPYNHLTGKRDDYFMITEEEALARAIEHRIFMEHKLGYLGE